MKTCTKCKTNYENIEENFNKDKYKKDGFHPYCKKCRSKQNKDNYYFKNPKRDNFCIDCGIDISDLNSNRIRCEGCNNIKEKKRKKVNYEKEKDSIEFKARRRFLTKKWRKNNPKRYKEQMKKHNDKRKMK